MKPLLKGTSQILFTIAGLLFLVGGRAISEYTRTDRLLSECAGIGLAVVFLVLGFAVKNAADDPNDEDSAAQ